MRHRWPKFLVVLSGVIPGLSGCSESPLQEDASGECAGDHAGRWSADDNHDGLEMSASCEYVYWQRQCRSRGRYALEDGTARRVVVTITQRDGSEECPLPGEYRCAYELADDDELAMNCGADPRIFTR